MCLQILLWVSTCLRSLFEVLLKSFLEAFLTFLAQSVFFNIYVYGQNFRIWVWNCKDNFLTYFCLISSKVSKRSCLRLWDPWLQYFGLWWFREGCQRRVPELWREILCRNKDYTKFQTIRNLLDVKFCLARNMGTQ